MNITYLHANHYQYVATYVNAFLQISDIIA